MTTTAAISPLRNRCTRVYWTCHFLRWLPLGLVMPVMALLPSERGLELAEIGVIFGVYSTVATVLGLPSGNLADVVGHKPVLLIAGLFEAAWYAGFLFATTVTQFAVAIALGGIGRALAASSLEAWYVDQIRAEAPDADVRRPISGAMFLTNVAVLMGALGAAGLPLLPERITSWADSVAVLPLLAAVVCAAVYVIVLARTITETRPQGGVRAAFREMNRFPGLAVESLRTAASGGPLRLLLIAGLAVGTGIGALEAFWQPQLAGMMDDPSTATTTFGLIVGASTVLGGCASLIIAKLPSSVARHAHLICAGLLGGLGTAILVFGLTDGFALAVAAYLAVHLFLELRAPLAQTLLHSAVPPGKRASVLATYAMSTNLGAVAATVGLGAFAGYLGMTTVWLAAGSITIVGGAAYLRLRATARRTKTVSYVVSRMSRL
ncbi:MFS transporter [Streptomyces scopuliridis]|uniref:MFS transporter n=1 Tax=Streptomyces scopuliridis TaxID=452529 RepID=UPI0035D86E02